MTRSIWWHYLTVHVPNDMSDADMRKSGYLFIDGGSNDNPADVPDETDSMLLFTGMLAATTKRYSLSLVHSRMSEANYTIR